MPIHFFEKWYSPNIHWDEMKIPKPDSRVVEIRGRIPDLNNSLVQFGSQASSTSMDFTYFTLDFREAQSLNNRSSVTWNTVRVAFVYHKLDTVTKWLIVCQKLDTLTEWIRHTLRSSINLEHKVNGKTKLKQHRNKNKSMYIKFILVICGVDSFR